MRGSPAALRTDTAAQRHRRRTGHVQSRSGTHGSVTADDDRSSGCPRHSLLLARLAVDVDEQGSGLGRGLLVDALRRSVRVAGDVGIQALLIHARDDEARDSSLHHGEFVASPADPLHLFLLLKHARQLLADEAQPR